METREYLVILLIGVAGLLIGGVFATWKTAKVMAGVLAVLAVLAGVGAILWLT